MWQLSIQILLIIALASQPLAVHGARKHWKRAPVHGAFNVDVYAYNKPLLNLAGQQRSESGPALPVDQLLEQLSHSSRREVSMAKSHYRNLDAHNYVARNQGVATTTPANSTAVATQIIAKSSEDLGATTTTNSTGQAINRQLEELQMDSSLKNSHAMRNLYSHEFHVQSLGTRKIVLLNTLSNGTQPGRDRKPDRAEIMVEQQTRPLNVKLALPALPESTTVSEEEEQQEVEQLQEELKEQLQQQKQPEGKPQEEKLEQTTTPQVIENGSTLELPPKYAEAISTLKQIESIGQSTTEQPNKSPVSEQLTDGTDDSKHGAKTIEVPNTANAYDRQQQEPKPTPETPAKQSDSGHHTDGQASGMTVAALALAESMPPTVATDKPKSKRKQTRAKTKKRPNEIDTKPTTSSSNQGLSSAAETGVGVRAGDVTATSAMPTVGTANVKAPVKESPEISTTSTHAPMLPLQGTKKRVKDKGKGKQKRKGSQRRPSGSQQEVEQEIETTTNWWQILPYAEIRKFLNTIYDSIAEDDDERRHSRNSHRAQRI